MNSQRLQRSSWTIQGLALVASGFVALCFFLPSKQAMAQNRLITPSYDSRVETNVLAAGVKLSGAKSRGSWRQPDGGLKPQKARGHYLVNGSADFRFRIRFRKKKKLKTRFVFAGEWDSRKGRIQSGYSIRIAGPYIFLESIKNGRFTRLTKNSKLWRIWYPKELEIVVTFNSGVLAAHVYDARKKERHGSIYSLGLKQQAGLIGIVNRGGSEVPPSFISLMSVVDACAPLRSELPGHAIVVKVQADSEVHQIEGVKAVDHWEPEPGCHEEPGGCHEQWMIRTDLAGVTRLLCSPYTVESFEQAPPWLYLDDGFRSVERSEASESNDPRLRWRVKSPRRVEAALRWWHEQYPNRTRLEMIGKSREGRPIWALAIGDFSEAQIGKPKFFFNGAHHGNEPLTPLIVFDIIEEMLTAEAGTKLWDIGQRAIVWLVPVVNPDGLWRHLFESSRYGRKNAYRVRVDDKFKPENGVDLNRNYPFKWGFLGERGSHSKIRSSYFRGASAGSEPETQAIMSLANREHFTGVISFHSGTVMLLAPYTINGIRNAPINEAWTISEYLVTRLKKPVQNRRFKVKRQLYPVDGIDEDWHRFAHGSLSLITEIAFYTPRTDAARRRVIKRNRPGWIDFMGRFFDGPSLSVQTVNAQGRPVRAQVEISRMTPPNGERWGSRCPGGYYHRFLPKNGVYKLRVNRGEPSAQVLSVRLKNSGNRQIKVVLNNVDPMDVCP